MWKACQACARIAQVGALAASRACSDPPTQVSWCICHPLGQGTSTSGEDSGQGLPGAAGINSIANNQLCSASAGIAPSRAEGGHWLPVLYCQEACPHDAPSASRERTPHAAFAGHRTGAAVLSTHIGLPPHSLGCSFAGCLQSASGPGRDKTLDQRGRTHQRAQENAPHGFQSGRCRQQQPLPPHAPRRPWAQPPRRSGALGKHGERLAGWSPSWLWLLHVTVYPQSLASIMLPAPTMHAVFPVRGGAFQR